MEKNWWKYIWIEIFSCLEYYYGYYELRVYDVV
jgi:hypothetical protein